jgi:hypothetical protein
MPHGPARIGAYDPGMDQLWVVIWLAVFATVTGLAGFLLYQNRQKRIAAAQAKPGEQGPHRPHGHHRQGH